MDDTTKLTLQQRRMRKMLSTDVKSFVSSCIHCLFTKVVTHVSRALDLSVHGTKPNDLIQFSYLELGQSSTENEYVLQTWKFWTGYFLFSRLQNPNSISAGYSILDWRVQFVTSRELVFNRPSRFRNVTVRHVTNDLQAPLYYTLFYCLWSSVSL